MKLKICYAMLFCLGTIVLCASAFAAEDAKTLKESLRSIATEIVTTGKEAMTGFSEGVEILFSISVEYKENTLPHTKRIFLLL